MKIRARLMTVSAVTFAAILTGCGSVGIGMMGRGSSLATNGWMMGGAPAGYNLRNVNCSPPATLPGTTIHAVLADMNMTQMMGGVAPLGGHMMLRATPADLKAGQVTFLAANMGWRTHELVVLPLPAGQTVGSRRVGTDGRVSENGSLGEASASCQAGAGNGILSGSVGWVTLNLRPGRYELICNLPNHYADGMYQEITVN